MKVTRFEDLLGWQRSRELNKLTYEFTQKGPLNKEFTLRDQMRRSSLSVMSNVVEGFEREGDTEFVQFLSQAKASCGEVRSQLYVALDLGYVNEGEFKLLHKLASEVSRVISGLIRYLRKSEYKGNKFK